MHKLATQIRSALVQLGARRAVVITILVFGSLLAANTWASYHPLREQEKFLKLARDNEQAVRGQRGGVCDDHGKCYFAGGIATRDLEGEDARDPAAVTQNRSRQRAEFVEKFELMIAATHEEFSARRTFETRIRFLGTLLGVSFAFFLAAFAWGAEWRWRLWRSLLVAEPRRARALIVKLASLWGVVVLATLAMILVAAATDLIARMSMHIPAGELPRIGTIAGLTSRSMLVMLTYATIGAGLAVLARSGTIALATGIGFVVADGLITQKYLWLRFALPAQQVVSLIPRPLTEARNGAVWWPAVSQSTTCNAYSCPAQELPVVAQGQAALVMLGWVAFAGLVAWAALRLRDIP